MINEFQAISSEVSRRHAPVSCGWKVFSDRQGVVLQLDTYGTSDREIPNKVSQSIQFDAEAAQMLLGLISRAFPGLQSR
jgi:hypothetical protein